MSVRSNSIVSDISDSEILYDVDLNTLGPDPMASALQDVQAIKDVYQRIAASEWFQEFQSFHNAIGISNAVLGRITPHNEEKIYALCNHVDAVAEMILNPHVGGEEPTEILRGVAALKKAEQNSLIQRAIAGSDLDRLDRGAFETEFFTLSKRQLAFNQTLAELPSAIRQPLKKKIESALIEEEENVLDLCEVLVAKISSLRVSDNNKNYTEFVKGQIEKDITSAINSAESLQEVEANLEKLSGKTYIFAYFLSLLLTPFIAILNEVLFFFAVIISLVEAGAAVTDATSPPRLDPNFLRKI